MKKTKIYFAGPWFTTTGMELMQYVMNIADMAKQDGSNYEVYFPLRHQGGTAEEVFNKDVEAVNNADIVIALVHEKDTGTAFEIGLAYAKGKQVYLLGKERNDFNGMTNLMLAFSAYKCFTVSEWYTFLTNAELVNYIDIASVWEWRKFNG